ncbi:MAG: hypothetical protein JWQ27_3156 [Ferruginibacter sp.]|nr:hypothetical protein [Ferruginibacter sp.]
MEINDIISSGLLEMYVLGIASSEESGQVEDWIGLHPEVKAELSRIEKSMESYAMANAIEPGNFLKKQVLGNISQADPHQKPVSHTGKVVSISPVWKTAAAAAVILLIGSSILNMVFYNKFQKANTAYEQTQQQLYAQNEKLEDMDRDMSVVQSKYSEPVALHGLEVSPEAAAKIFWMKNTGEVYIDPTNLPAAPAGKQYQLWAIVDGKPVDGGMIITSAKGKKYQIQKMKTFGKAEAFAVTLETEGGNPTPKGDMYVMGKM